MRVQDLKITASESDQRLDEILKFLGAKSRSKFDPMFDKKTYKAALAELKKRLDAGEKNPVMRVALDFGLDSPKTFQLVAQKAGILPQQQAA